MNAAMSVRKCEELRNKLVRWRNNLKHTITVRSRLLRECDEAHEALPRFIKIFTIRKSNIPGSYLYDLSNDMAYLNRCMDNLNRLIDKINVVMYDVDSTVDYIILSDDEITTVSTHF